MANSALIQKIFSGSLVMQIAIGIVAGIALALTWPEAATAAMLFGDLFVGALKAVAPVLVLVLVAAALANQEKGSSARMKPIVGLYLIGTLSAAFLAVTVSTLFPTTLILKITDVTLAAPQGIVQVLQDLLFKLVDNPVNAIATGNFIGILVWGCRTGNGDASCIRQQSSDAGRYRHGRDQYRAGRYPHGTTGYLRPGRR